MGSNFEVVELDLAKRTSPGKWTNRLNFLVLLFGFAMISLNGWLRMVGSISYWYWLTAANISPGPLYLLISGVVWGVIGLTAFLWIALRRPNYPLVGFAAALIFAFTYWVDRLFIKNQESSVPNMVFSILFTLLAMVFVLGVLRPFSRSKSPTQTIE